MSACIGFEWEQFLLRNEVMSPVNISGHYPESFQYLSNLDSQQMNRGSTNRSIYDCWGHGSLYHFAFCHKGSEEKTQCPTRMGNTHCQAVAYSCNTNISQTMLWNSLVRKEDLTFMRCRQRMCDKTVCCVLAFGERQTCPVRCSYGDLVLRSSIRQWCSKHLEANGCDASVTFQCH